MKHYSSNEEFFAAVRLLAMRMETTGATEAAREIRNGFTCLNGLTDGWAMFMETLESVLSKYGRQLPADQKQELRLLLDEVRQIVFRNIPQRLLHHIRNRIFRR